MISMWASRMGGWGASRGVRGSAATEPAWPCRMRMLHVVWSCDVGRRAAAVGLGGVVGGCGCGWWWGAPRQPVSWGVAAWRGG